MQTQVTQTNTTSAVATLAHADIVRLLGLAVAVDAGLRSDAPGTSITVELAPAEADGEFAATVSVLIDHNYVAPETKPDDGAGTGDASLKSDGAGQPATPPAPPVQQPAGGLQIPSTPTA